jgi:hypothetical protein
MAQTLTTPRAAPAFVTNNPRAEIISSEAMNIIGLHYENKEIRAIGADGNVRVCKIDRLPSVEVARGLWKRLRTAMDNGEIISFQAAGGFSPNRWFFDITAE